MMIAAPLGHPSLLLPCGAAPVFGCCGNKVTAQLKKGAHSLFSAIYIGKAELC